MHFVCSFVSSFSLSFVMYVWLVSVVLYVCSPLFRSFFMFAVLYYVRSLFLQFVISLVRQLCMQCVHSVLRDSCISLCRSFFRYFVISVCLSTCLYSRRVSLVRYVCLYYFMWFVYFSYQFHYVFSYVCRSACITFLLYVFRQFVRSFSLNTDSFLFCFVNYSAMFLFISFVFRPGFRYFVLYVCLCLVRLFSSFIMQVVIYVVRYLFMCFVISLFVSALSSFVRAFFT